MRKLLVVLVLALLTPGLAQSGGKRVAFVVGCNGYGNDAWNLQAAVPDARSVATFLREAGYDVTLLTDEAMNRQGVLDPALWLPTKPNLESRLQATFQGGYFGPNDTLVFFFAGHGVKLEDAAGVPQDFLLPLGTPVPPTDGRALVAVEFVRYVMEKSEAGNLVLITDACRVEGEQRSGPTLARGFGERTAAEVRGAGGTMAGERRTALMRSCQALQVARADGDGGWYTKALVAGLRGPADGYGDQGVKDGSVTVAEAHAYAKDQVADQARRNDKEQVPDLQQAGSAAAIVLAGRAGGGIKPVALKARLRIVTMPDGAAVVMDGRQVGTTPFDQEYDLAESTRKVRVELRRDGYLPQAYEVTLARGVPQILDNVELRRVPAPTPAPTQPAPTPTPPSDQRPAGWPSYLSSYQPPAGMNWSSFRVSPKDGMPQVLIPAGEFLMGSPDSEAGRGSDEGPQKRVYVSAFWMDLHEVTVGQYKRFCQATNRQMPPPSSYGWEDRHPVSNVTWADAAAYCQWAGRRLPTEAEWEKAARGGREGQPYVWGNQWPPPRGSGNFADVTANNLHLDWPIIDSYDDGYAGVSPVGNFAPNKYGLYDLAGNVKEWCQDWYDAGWYARMPGRDPCNTTEGSARVLRGGSLFNAVAQYLRAALRSSYSPGARRFFWGFRGVAGAAQGSSA